MQVLNLTFLPFNFFFFKVIFLKSFCGYFNFACLLSDWNHFKVPFIYYENPFKLKWVSLKKKNGGKILQFCEISMESMYKTNSSPQGLRNPHDVAVDPSSMSVYVGELNPQAVWKLSRVSMPTVPPHTHSDHNDVIQGGECCLIKKGIY